MYIDRNRYMFWIKINLEKFFAAGRNKIKYTQKTVPLGKCQNRKQCCSNEDFLTYYISLVFYDV